jgi:heat-inducible transcriptional repressor
VGSDVTDADLAEASALLNGWLSGGKVADAAGTLARKMRDTRPPIRRVLQALLAARSRFLRRGEADSVHYEGARYIFRHPEFLDDASCLGNIFDSEDALAEVVRRAAPATPVTIKIGRENTLREMRQMSLVVGSYRVGAGLARMAVLGPMRMRYPRLVGLMGYLSDVMERMFTPK